ncbi:nicotinate (nicotinamide) nucleotide adenylyltransferase [Carboxylicivirga linearis]|uniref:Probable nicotinate-nucleotide adenylyltransferase n=1 Tax=Carboxylicivirga linearis TaxID=1628157 RepID=A0ABS5JVI1_9BACT|nr:nicotinate (nicotinamide) nucleotide adenylyltransferase [Carboxylicivirga linearis]MBS2098912.1 nicotinate-nucleotide adenylyltransferase [Carboxylicivirga linearis]
MKQIGLFFGSFNPIHIGHLALANYMCEFEEMDEVWFVVSPQNPFKSSLDLISTHHRIKMVELAIAQYANFQVEDIESSMPVPSYTINTLTELRKIHSDCEFNIIMGADNIQNIHRWKDGDRILTDYCILVYPRLRYSTDHMQLPLSVRITEAPNIEVSSTQIREWIKNGKQLPFLTSPAVMNYINTNHLYQ